MPVGAQQSTEERLTDDEIEAGEDDDRGGVFGEHTDATTTDLSML